MLSELIPPLENHVTITGKEHALLLMSAQGGLKFTIWQLLDLFLIYDHLVKTEILKFYINVLNRKLLRVAGNWKKNKNKKKHQPGIFWGEIQLQKD